MSEVRRNGLLGLLGLLGCGKEVVALVGDDLGVCELGGSTAEDVLQWVPPEQSRTVAGPPR